MRPSRDKWAIDVAKLTAGRSTCKRRQVGCTLLNARGHVMATGYNGVASGVPHCNEFHVRGVASVPRLPVPEHWEIPEAVYLRRAIELHPEAVGTLGLLEPHAIVESTVKGRVGVDAKVFANACSGASAPSGQSLDACQAIHAEQNALLQCRDVYAIHTAFVTASPCVTCTKLLLNTSCERIVYLDEYPHPEARAMWEKAGRTWEKYKEPS